MLTFFLIGAAIGALTGVPIGPVNVAVIDAAYRHTLRRGVAVGLGGAIGDFIYSGAAMLWIGPHVIGRPGVKPVLFAISGVVLIVYGILTIRSRPPAAPAAAPHLIPPYHEVWNGLTVGIGLILLNPAAIVTWVVVVGSHLNDLTTLEALGAAGGVFVGSLAWFTFVAFIADKGKRIMGERAVWVMRIVGVGLVGYGVYSLGRAIRYLVA
ncbi:MAG: LysE family transporter [Myxococcales bacterium]|nr:LysE family transporter [Myxococcales bacterium]